MGIIIKNHIYVWLNTPHRDLIILLLLPLVSFIVTSSCTTTTKVVHTSSISSKLKGINGHEYVDLGLPSKTVWATCNVGAETAEDYGNFYAWGETKPKANYSWNTLSLLNDSVTKDVQRIKSASRIENSKETFHFLTDEHYTRGVKSIKLLPQHDAATANWGKNWSTPTQEQWCELSDTSLCQWVQQKKGFQIVSKKNGNSIFLPACGMYNAVEAPKTFFNDGDSVRYEGHYWGATLSHVDSVSYSASCLFFHTGYQRMRFPVVTMMELYSGMSVRSVATLFE